MVNRILTGIVVIVLGASSAVLGTCGPFTDVAADAFCPFVVEIFTLGITAGTTATTYDPSGNVTRLQMAAFLSRTVDRSLERAGKRAALKRFWSPGPPVLGVTSVGANGGIEFDGRDLWVGGYFSDSISRVRTSDGRVLGTWTGASANNVMLVATGRVFGTGDFIPGLLYSLDPTQPPGSVTTVASNLGGHPYGIAFDGSRIWTSNGSGSVSIVTPGAWTVTTVTSGFENPFGILYDGANVWVADTSANTLLRLDSSGAILQTVTVGSSPIHPFFDGSNIWVPSSSNAISVVRASSGAVLATLTGNGLNFPRNAASDGQRVLVVNNSGGSVSLWKAADLTPLGSVAVGLSPVFACSDGVDFWVGLNSSDTLLRF